MMANVLRCSLLLLSFFVISAFCIGSFAENIDSPLGQEAKHSDDDLLAILDQNSWSLVMESNDFVLVLYTEVADDCYHCVRAEEEIAIVIGNYSTVTQEKILFARVDCMEEKELCEKNNIGFYPAVQLHTKRHTVFHYPDEVISARSLLAFLEKNTKPTTIFLENSVQFEQALERHRTIAVGFFKDEASKAYPSFQRASVQMHEEITFAEVFLNDEFLKSDSNARYAKYIDENAIICFKHKLNGIFPNPYQGRISRKRLVNWLQEIAVSGVEEMKDSDVTSLFVFNKPILITWLDYTYPKIVEHQVLELEEAASKFQNEIKFVFANKDQYPDYIEYLAITSYPMSVIIDRESGHHFAYPADRGFSHTNIAQFAENFLNNQLWPYVQKEQTPDNQNAIVKSIVYDTFLEFVHTKGKDVIIFFYLDTCPYCTEFLPIYEEVAKSFANDQSIVFGKINLSKNRNPPGKMVTSFPTVQLIPISNRNFEVEFHAQRTAEKLLQWIAANRTPVEVIKEAGETNSIDETMTST